jgi:hypothetical protein
MQSPRIIDETIVEFPDGPKLTGSPSRQTLTRWSTEGVESKSTGEVITLEWAQIGYRRVTSLEAYERFLARLNGEQNALSG